MIYADIIGSMAAFLTTVAFIPQMMRVLKTRDTHAISLPMYLMFTTGICLWLCYGWMIGSWPMIIGNIVTLVCALVILAVKLASPRSAGDSADS